MKLGYTEFSFGYAFTENLIRSAAKGPAHAPFFPNLVQEAQLGYDVRIDFPAHPLFFQYKLPELMIRNTAKEISQYALAGISVPFFRMPLMRRYLSQQHQLLIDLERKFPRTVYYVTSGMKDIRCFHSAYNAIQVHQRSVFFSPGNIGPITDDKQHVIAYRAGSRHAWLCSEPRQISAFDFEDIQERARNLFEQERFRTLEVVITDVREAIRSMVSQDIQDSENAIRERIRTRIVTLAGRQEIDGWTREVTEELLVSREIARVGLGLELMVAQPRQHEGP